MSDSNNNGRGLSPQEREQITYLVRFLAIVLVCVLLASLAAGLLITLFQ
jgi:hypothetical protein